MKVVGDIQGECVARAELRSRDHGDVRPRVVRGHDSDIVARGLNRGWGRRRSGRTARAAAAPDGDGGTAEKGENRGDAIRMDLTHLPTSFEG